MHTLDTLTTVATDLDAAALEVTGGIIPRDLYCFFWPELCGPFWP